MAWKMINARAETVATASAFKAAYGKRRRCLVPVDGFYEWRKIGSAKQPYAIGMADGEPFTLARLWENWKDPDSGKWQRTFTIVTTEANEFVAKLHDRMPVVVAPEDVPLAFRRRPSRSSEAVPGREDAYVAGLPRRELAGERQT